MKRRMGLVLFLLVTLPTAISCVSIAFLEHDQAVFWKSQSDKWETAWTEASDDRIKQIKLKNAALKDYEELAKNFDLHLVKCQEERNRRIEAWFRRLGRSTK